MANRRMFSMTIIDTDAFLEMPDSSQVLYFHLAMRADDDGFISNPKRISRMIGASDDDLKLLVTKEFLIPFESGVCVIRHWRLHNYIRKDRYTPTFHKFEKSLIGLTDNNSYTDDPTEMVERLPDEKNKGDKGLLSGRPLVDQVSYQRLPQDRLEIEIETKEEQEEEDKIILSKELKERIITEWNKLPVADIRTLSEARSKKIKILLQTYGEEDLFKAIDNVNKSNFLQGINDRGWVITIDWFLKGNNFIKVLEGNYNKVKQHKQQAKKKGIYRVNGDREETDYKKLANRFMEGL